MLAAAVLRLSTSAVTDDWLVISDQKCGQSTLAATAISGTTTNSAPIAAGTIDPAGQAGRRPQGRTVKSAVLSARVRFTDPTLWH